MADPAEINQPAAGLYKMFTSVRGAVDGQQQSVVRYLDIRADGVIADRLGLESSTPLVYLERLRIVGAHPLAVDRAWLPAAVASPLVEIDFSQASLCSELAVRCGVAITGCDEVVRAVVPTLVEQQFLEIARGTAAFVVERISYAGTQPVEWRHTVIRADRFSLSTQYSGRGGLDLISSATAT